MEDEMRYRRIQSDYRYTAKLLTATVLVACLFTATALFARPSTQQVDRLWWASAVQGDVLQQDGPDGWRTIEAGDAIPAGSQVKIGTKGRLILVRADSFLNFPPNGRFTLPE
jgi:hypothetical protein